MTIFKILLLLAIILSGNFFEELERERPKLFWGLTIGLATVFTQLDDNSLTHNPSLPYTEQILVRGGSDSGQSNPSFIGGRPGRGTGKTDQGTSTGSTSGNGGGYPGPRIPWVSTPGFHGSGSCNRLDTHQRPAARDWVSDPSAWEDDERDHPLGVPVDFPYQLNKEGDPTLFVPNLGNTVFQGVGKSIRVEFDQTASHMHHAADFGINLPDNFDMAYYQTLGRGDKIAYAKRELPRNTIISYQNEIGKRLLPVYNPNTYSVAGIPGQQKVPTQLVFSKPRDPYPLPGQKSQTPASSGKRDIMLGIVTQDGLHISSYSITQKRLDRIEMENFWVLKNQDI